MAKIPSKETIKRATITDMKKLGVYKPQYNRLIDIYAELVHQYFTLNDEFEKGAYQYEVETDQGGKKKAPIVATLKTLRKDILAYSDRLCLNPQSMKATKINSGKKKSSLASVLEKLS
jgi:phage terminase small subunit